MREKKFKIIINEKAYLLYNCLEIRLTNLKNSYLMYFNKLYNSVNIMEFRVENVEADNASGGSGN